MKLVFLAPFGIRPKGTVIARMLPLAVELQKLGHTVTIVAPPYTNPEDSGKIEFHKGVRLVNVVLPTCGKAMATLPLAWRMFRAMLQEQPDIVHLFKPKGYGGIAALAHLLIQRLGIRLPPLFVDSDDWEGSGGMNDLHSYSFLEKKLFAFQEQWLSRLSAGVSVASRTLETLTCNIGIASDHICYIPNCVTETPPGYGGYIREKLGISYETPVVLLYTRFFEFSQERLYQVFSDIFFRVPTVCFLVVGKGRNNEEERLTASAKVMGFDTALVMAGWIEPEKLPDYLAAGDVAIYPLEDNLTNRAKCPAKLTELLLAGVPVIADCVGQATEYIADGISGILCDPNNPAQMVDKTVRLLLEPENRKKYAADGKRFLLERFVWSDAVAKLDQFYRSIIAL